MPITPTPGSDAVAAGIPLVPGTGLASDLEEYINQTRDIIAQRTNAVQPIAKGGTGATSESGARGALGITAANTPSNGATGGGPSNVQADLQFLNGKINTTQGYVDNHGPRITSLETGKLDKTGGTVSGPLYLPSAYAADSSFTIAYVNGDGRISKGASSERYKKDISPIDPGSLGNIFPELHRFKMRSVTSAPDGNPWRYGYIAERLAEHTETDVFVVYQTDENGAQVRDSDGNRVPDSIDFIGLLLSQVAQLHQAVDLLAQRVELLEGRA